MKKLIICSLLGFLLLPAAYAQYRTERTGYEGDYFSLEGAIDLFRQSFTLRDFERKINTQENWVNNLDLNYDGRTDYIRVEHRQERNFHAIILQALIDRYEAQDVAVIEIEITGRNEAILQIVGDEDLYGEEVVVEPIEGYNSSRAGYHPEYGSFVNVYYWDAVQHMLGLQYTPYVSPYAWRYYPAWWDSWTPFSWNVFRPRIVVYHHYYRVIPRPRVIHVHNFYRPYRSYCPRVVQRSNEVRVRQGRAPVYRDRGPDSYRRRSDVVEPRDVGPRRDEPRPDAPISRKRTEYDQERNEVRSRTDRDYPSRPGADSRPRSEGQADSPATPRANPPASRNSRPDYERAPSRSSSPQVRQSPDNETIRSRPSRSTEPGQQTRSSRNEEYSRPSSGRSTPPAVNQAPRNETPRTSAPSRSGTATRSSGSDRQPAARSSNTAPASKPELRESTPAKRSSPEGESKPRSRKGN